MDDHHFGCKQKSLNKTLVLTADYSGEISVLEQEEKPFIYTKANKSSRTHVTKEHNNRDTTNMLIK
jgi:hypothetical protein